MKCKTNRCGAACCYNIPFTENELERFSDKIVTPVLYLSPLGSAMVAHTHPEWRKNKCPFLRHDLRCNIYEARPRVCRLMAEVKEMPCKYIRK